VGGMMMMEMATCMCKERIGKSVRFSFMLYACFRADSVTVQVLVMMLWKSHFCCKYA
jgi:hypothetical protein